ncbi:hypothetical protein DPMN_125384 [Dreissena polymorpha]|uniref:Uncharacterized protein n=1 Tax=Dreissena polymorpha TaxID=45954 RepID=A0A9D4GTV7_DREPO|nr:hypothetical protein DPMN_125384 [Dreissena polymorpha]
MPPTPSAALKYFTTSSDKKSPIQVTFKRGNFKRLTVYPSVDLPWNHMEFYGNC